MKIEKIIQKNHNIAVFARNHRKYLEAATTRNKEDPGQPTTFRASTTWKSAHYAKIFYDDLKIYFAPVGSEKMIEYEAIVKIIKLYPKRNDRETETLLGFELDETKGEGLWEKYDKRLDTLYVINRCVRLKKPFPINHLIKVSDDVPISENYGYSYCLVYSKIEDDMQDFEIRPEEISEPKKYFEGSVRQVSVNIYERSKVARAKCIQYHGLNCSVCDVNFEKVYGHLGAGFIHVHHVKPLVHIDERYEVNPIEDLIPVCPNCHSILHKRDPSCDVSELKLIIEQEKRNQIKAF